MNMREHIEAVLALAKEAIPSHLCESPCVDCEQDSRLINAIHAAMAEAERVDLEMARLKVAEGEAMLVVESQDASIARLKAHIETLRGQRDVVATEGTRLRAKLEKYTQPLTDEQGWFVLGLSGADTYHHNIMDIDAAIRAAREGER